MERSRAVKRAADRGTATINVHLIILVLVALLPTVTFALVLVFRLNAKEREVFERGTRDTVRALTAAVDSELGAAISSLEMLAASEHLEGADLRSFHGEAAAAHRTRTGWVSISLASPDGDPLLNVLRPYGVPLPPIAEREMIRKVVETRRPVIGNLTPGSVTKARQVPLLVPVIRGGEVRYILTARVNPTTVHGVLEAQRVPAEWTGAILDGNGVVVARTRAAERFVGLPGAPVMRSAAAAPPEGWIQGDTLDGVPSYMAYARSRFSGWTVSLAVPATDVDGPLLRSLWGVAAAGVVFIAAGVVAAAVIGTRIARPLGALAHAADALAGRDPPAMPRSPVVEVDAVASAIDQAARERRAAEEEIRFLAEASEVLVSSLDYETTLEAVARLAVPRLADWSGVHVLDADGSIRCLALAHGDRVKEQLGRQLLDRYPSRPGGRRGVPHVLQTGAPILQPEFPPDFFGRLGGRADLDTIRSFGLRSLMIVPLTARGRTFGTMTFVTAESGRRYTGADLRIAQSLAQRAAIAVDNAKLYAEAERRRREADVVAELGRSINASLEADTVLLAVVRAARDLCDADFTRIALRDAESDAMLYRYTEATRYEGYGQLRIDPGKGVTAWVLQTGRPLRTESVADDDRAEPQHAWLIEAEGTVSALILPIRVGARVEGLIYCGRRQRRAFSAGDEDIGMRLAAHAATALRNAQLYAGEQRARTEAEALNRLKDEFLATLSHELRTPLNAMLGWVTMLKTGALDPATTARGLDTIERNTRLQAQLIEDLLDVSRIVAGKLHLDVRPLELGDVIRAAVDAVRPAATAKDLRLDVVVEAPPIPVSGDPARLQQVVWNLLSNAVKFTPAGGDVSVHVRRRDGRAVIEVRDTGLGIGAEFLPHVFDRFRQADASTTRRYGGLGLGLTIVRELVEVHGGTVRAESPGEGRGSTFVVELPLIQAPRDAPRSHAPLLAPVSLLRGVKVLVVDDDRDTREVLEMGLERQEAEVFTAGSVEEALAVLARDLPDVLVTDIAMPGEDGYALLRRVRTSDRVELRRLPAVALTAHARGEDRARAEAEGFEAYEPKPVDPVGFAETVARVVRQGRLTG